MNNLFYAPARRQDTLKVSGDFQKAISCVTQANKKIAHSPSRVYDTFASEAYAGGSGHGIVVESPKCADLARGRTWNGKPSGLAFRLAMTPK